MVMRYYWGLGVGHVYLHKSSCLPILCATNSQQPEDPSCLNGSENGEAVNERTIDPEDVDQEAAEDDWLDPDHADQADQEEYDSDDYDNQLYFHWYEMYYDCES